MDFRYHGRASVFCYRTVIFSTVSLCFPWWVMPSLRADFYSNEELLSMEHWTVPKPWPWCSCVGCRSLEGTKVKGYSKGESLFGRINGLFRRGKEMIFSLYHVKTHSTTAHKPRRFPCEELVRQSWTSAPRSIRDKFLMLKPSRLWYLVFAASYMLKTPKIQNYPYRGVLRKYF